MAETITPAHRVLIDAMGFLGCLRMADPWERLALSAIESALPYLQRTDIAVLDRLCQRAAELVQAHRQVADATAPLQEGARIALAGAQLAAAQAAADFFRARLGQSAQKIFEELQNPAAAATAEPGQGGGDGFVAAPQDPAAHQSQGA